MNTFVKFRIVIVTLTIAAFFQSCTEKKEEIRFNNPLVLQRADPWVHKTDDGIYYFIATSPEFDRIEIRKSETINGIADAEAHVVWSKHASGPMSHHIWAPELHRFNDTWYIYFAAGRSEDVWRIRMWVLSNDSEDPTQGEWVEEGQIHTQRDAFALDATTFEHRGKRYLIWTENGLNDFRGTGLLIAEMKDHVTIDEREVIITKPEYDWEIQGHWVNEGPAVLKRNNRIFVTFSASATDHNYAIGLLWAYKDSDLLDPASWNKLPEPVFYTNPEFNRFGPGHNSFTVAEDGKTDIMIYHARDYMELQGNPLSDPNRHTRARVITWTEDGFPDFGQDIDD
ncbi:glycoside hydrolase family 43 protein [Natronoflexus pectinivorans]|uniref:GH43 family beta-xylosidase n=1 Tax=Natronoflexus pectinivorans TaxID=682526 RepID=A0A4V2RVY2_9BACT|nr:glycoside hydrolase family 43 protein [Natronoflexus pectinivorans]TCO06124.1 GH43 family beta-xylosidase [Natronoflexus pectinivorans]